MNLWCNLKPFIAYVFSFSCCAYITLVADLNTSKWGICALILLCILNGIIGYTHGVKKIKWGISLLCVLLSLGAVLNFVPSIDSRVVVFANLILSTVFYHSKSLMENLLFAMLSVILPTIPFFAGSFLKSKIKHKA